MKITKMAIPGAVLLVAAIFQPVLAETVTTRTYVQQKDVPNAESVNLLAFDTNKDGVLNMREVGEYLFKKFDRDGNGSIDNIEFNQKGFITVIPMEKQTLQLVDYDNDGVADVSNFSEQDFIKESHLMRFDGNKDGLTPAEFISMGYEELDDDEDKLINMEEWKEAYMASLHPAVNEPERYN